MDGPDAAIVKVAWGAGSPKPMIQSGIQQGLYGSLMHIMVGQAAPRFRATMVALLTAGTAGIVGAGRNLNCFLKLLNKIIHMEIFIGLQEQGVLSNLAALIKPMKPSQEVLSEGVSEKDVVVLILYSADALRILLKHEAEGRVPLSTSERELLQVLKYGGNDSKGATVFTRALTDSLFSALRYYAHELDAPTALTRELLESSVKLMYINVAGLAIALTTSLDMLSGVVVCASADYDRKAKCIGNLIWTNTPGKLHFDKFGEWIEFMMWVRVKVRDKWKWMWKRICAPLIFRTVLIGWMCVSLRGNNGGWGTLGKNRSVVVPRTGGLMLAICHNKFRQNYGTVINLFLELPSGRDRGNVYRLFCCLHDWLLQDKGDHNCNMFNQRLLKVERFLKGGKCGVNVLFWYADICKGVGAFDEDDTRILSAGEDIPVGYGILHGTAVGALVRKVVRWKEPVVLSAEDFTKLCNAIRADGLPNHLAVLDDLSTLMPSMGKTVLVSKVLG